MIRIGLVDCTTSHADAFSKIFNVQKKFRGFKVTKCWDVKAKRAREVADLYGLEAVKSLSDMTGIDAVMVLSRDQNRHLPYARPFLKRGMPAFIDKTTAGSLAQARSIYSLAKKHKAPVFSASAVRFAREVEDAVKVMKTMKKVRYIRACGPGELIFYGQHVFDAIYALVGRGAQKVQNVGTDKVSILRIDFKGGLLVEATVSQVGHLPFTFTVADEKSCHTFTITDHVYFYWNMIKAFVNMVKTGKPPFDPRETLEIIDGMYKAQASHDAGGKPKRISGKYKI